MLKSLSEIKANTPSKLDHVNQLYQLISLCLSRTLEDVEACYKENMGYHISTVTTMLKVHDDTLLATKNLIKQAHIRHE